MFPYPLKNLDHMVPWHTYFCVLLRIKAMFLLQVSFTAFAYCALVIIVRSLSLFTHPICQWRDCVHSKEDVARTSLCLQPQADLGPLNTREYGTMCCPLTWEPRGFRTALGPEYHCAALVTTQHLGEIWFK